MRQLGIRGSAIGRFRNTSGLRDEVARLRVDNDNLRQTLELRRSEEAWAEESFYIASEMRSKFHRPGCKWAMYISEPRRTVFGSRSEAVQAGFKPCRTCCS